MIPRSYHTFNCPVANRASDEIVECECERQPGTSAILGTRKAIARKSVSQLELIRPEIDKTSFMQRRKRRWNDISPSSIDKYSRLFFPLIFCTFNALYWIISLSLQGD